jgi:hypothetical protein
MGKRGKRNWLWDLKYIYGMSEQQYMAMLEEQKGRCAICGFIPKEGENRLCIDHSHDSLKIRGLICSWCNTALGRFKDSPSIIKAALRYLTKKRYYGKVNFTRGKAA